MRQRLPPLDWHGAVRLLQADRALVKYNPDEPRDWHGRRTTDAGSGGGVPPRVAPPHPQPATHPAAASTPNHRNPLFHLIGASEEGESGDR